MIPRNRITFTSTAIAGFVILGTLIEAVRCWPQSGSPQPDSTVAAASAPIAVSALGRIEPQGGVTCLSVSELTEGARVARLLVKEGDMVRAGQIVAVLESEALKLAALREAHHQVAIAESRLAQTCAPAKATEIETQRHASTRLRAELAQAEREWQRYAVLAASGDVAMTQLDGKRLMVETLKAELARAQAQQATLTEYRQVDADVARAEIARAKAAVARLETEVALTRLTAPVDGMVLKLHSRVGEAIGAKGLLEIGATHQMYVVAEVHETDIARVQPGAEAVMTARALAEPLTGEVERIGLRVGKKETPDNDPAAEDDARVVEVFICLKPGDSVRAQRLTNLRVEVVIKPGSAECR
jgi:HlyD family secretion protein